MKSLFTVVLVLILAAMFVPFATAQTTVGNTPTCNQYAILDNVTATTKVISAVPASTSTIFVNGVATTVSTNQKHIHICHIFYRVKQTASPANFGLSTGTGTNCGTGTANFSPQWVGTASTTDSQSLQYGADGALSVPAAKDLCFSLSATPTQAQIGISYGIY